MRSSSLFLRTALQESSLARPLFSHAQLPHLRGHFVVEGTIDEILGEEDLLELFVGLLVSEELSCFLQLPLALPAFALVEKSIGELDFFAVLDFEPGMD